VLYNLHILDINDQLVKVNPRIGGGGSDDGLLACSRLEYSTSAPDDYTNGISAHHATDWVVRDNQWYRIPAFAMGTAPLVQPSCSGADQPVPLWSATCWWTATVG
jgi:hypothetical protein